MLTNRITDVILYPQLPCARFRVTFLRSLVSFEQLSPLVTVLSTLSLGRSGGMDGLLVEAAIIRDIRGRIVYIPESRFKWLFEHRGSGGCQEAGVLYVH